MRVATVVCLGFLLTACSPSTSKRTANAARGNGEGDRRFTIGFIPGVNNDPFYIALKDGIEQRANDLGMDLVYQGSNVWDPTKQTPIVESMIARGIDLLIISPTSEDAMIEPLRKVYASGIPIITVDTTISDDSFIISNITADNRNGGRLGGETLAGLLHYRGEVALFASMPGVTTSNLRLEGFREAIARYKEMHIVSVQFSNDQPQRVASLIQQIALAHPKLAGAAGVDLYCAQGLSTGAKAQNLNIQIVAFDAGPVQIEALRNGDVAAVICQKPLAEGQTAVEYAYFYLNGRRDAVRKRVLIPPIVADRNNMDEPEVRKWFYSGKEQGR